MATALLQDTATLTTTIGALSMTSIENLDPPTSDSDQMTLERTRLAYERTQLAWIRTATNLIAFGFTVYKFFEYESSKLGASPPKHWLGPRHFAILMISTGLTALLLSTIEHALGVRALRSRHRNVRTSLAGLLAFLIFVLGAFGLFAAVFRQ